MSLKHTLKKFHLRNIEQIKLRRVETQNGERQYTSTVIIKFGYPVIVSHFQLVRTAKQEHPFEFGHIEGNLLGDFVDYERFLGTRLVGKAKRDTRHDGKAVAMEVLNFEASGVGEIVNLTFTMKRTFYHECRKYCLGKMGLSGEYAFSDEKENQLQSLTRKKVREEFRNYFYSITFYGISSAKSIKPFVGMLLINLGLRFRKHEMFLSENEVQLATALALTNEKKVRIIIYTTSTTSNRTTTRSTKNNQNLLTPLSASSSYRTPQKLSPLPRKLRLGSIGTPLPG